MNRRTVLLAGAGLALAPIGTHAQEADGEAIVTEFLRILTEQDWNAIDAIMAEDYAPFYARSDELPGREAWKQRRASNNMADILDTFAYVPIAVMQDGDVVMAWAEVQGATHSGRDIRVPYLLVVQLRDGKIVAGHGGTDETLFLEQLAG